MVILEFTYVSIRGRLRNDHEVYLIAIDGSGVLKRIAMAAAKKTKNPQFQQAVAKQLRQPK
jgi:hypothetical protein